jgi:hypothetical protein
MLDLQNQQKDRFPDRIDGRGKSSLQNMPIISINVLAKRPQSSNLHKLLGRTHEYG